MLNALLKKEYRGFWKSDNLPAPLLPQEEKILFQMLEINPGDKKVKDEIVERNTRLVLFWAEKINSSHLIFGSGLAFEDLCQAGVIGLMKAVDKYQCKKGYKFSIYASWWIRQTLTRALAAQVRTIRIPVNIVETISKYTRVGRKLLQDLGREPLAEEIAAKMGIDVSKVRFIEEIKDDTISLDKPLSGDEENNPLIDFTEDKKINSPSVEAEAEDIREKLKEILSSLDPREEKILMMRFGLEDGKYYILQEVGDVLGITKERVRQIQKKALRKLKRDPRTILLK